MRTTDAPISDEKQVFFIESEAIKAQNNRCRMKNGSRKASILYHKSIFFKDMRLEKYSYGV